MISEPLQTRSHLDPEFIHALEPAQLLDRAGHIGQNGVGQPFRNSVGAPEILNQRAALLSDVADGLNGDGAIGNELSGLDGGAEQSKDHQCEWIKRGRKLGSHAGPSLPNTRLSG